MAREVEHVEQALSDLQASRLGPADHSDEQDVDRESSARTVADVGPRVHSAAVRSEDDLAPKERPGRRLAVTAAAVVAGLALVVLVVVFLLRPVTDDLSDSGAAAVLEPSPTPRPTAPAATPTRVPVDPSRVRLAELLADARHERQLGNLDAAIEHLSVLALIDRDDTSVLETAQGIIADLKRLAEQAAQEEDGWRAAKAHLDRARDLALRFGMETREIDRLWRNIAAMELTHRLAPTDTTALQARVGTEVDVILRSGETETGWLKAVTRTLITLETRDRFGGGYVTYDTELQVSAIEAIEYTTPVVPQ
jgi:hypothetical protein